jgi:hypothetical protein
MEDEDADRMGNVWRIDPGEAHKFHQARMGDHLMVAFECDQFVFRKLYRCEPIETEEDALNAAFASNLLQERYGLHTSLNKENDGKALATIRRMILDAFWSRASSTVRSNAKVIQRGCELSASLGLDPPYLEPGPLPSFDHCGYGVAIQMLLASQEPGRHSAVYKQFDTIRHFKTGYGNQIRASGQANAAVTAIGDADGKTYQRMCSDPCASIWFGRFVTGCRRRMGQDWRPDEAVSPRLVKALMRILDDKIA